MKNLSLSIILSLILSMTFAQENRVKFIIETPFGNLKGELYNETPLHRDNFVKLVKEGWYEDSPFHRVIRDFMIQGGQNKDGRKDPGYTVPAEFLPEQYIHKKGALAAARLGDNINPKQASSGSQFYIVQGTITSDDMLMNFERSISHKAQSAQVREYLNRPENADILAKVSTLQRSRKNAELNEFIGQIKELMLNEGIDLPEFHYTEQQKAVYRTLGGSPHLDGAYTVFGEITEGFDVIDKIAAVPTAEANVPVEPISMIIRILE